MDRIRIEFFHDVVCGWCFVLSPRLKRIAADLPVDIEHRCFVLQDSPAEMERVFGSLPRAKEVILGHWVQCAAADDIPGRINIEGMRRQSFAYPSGLAGTLACKSAERQGGSTAHGALFDRIQAAHLTENRNIADPRVLTDCAAAVGLDMARFEADMADPATRELVEQDRARARALAIRSIPSLVIGQRVISSTLPYHELRRRILACAASTPSVAC
ncbi:DsbA family oxidoreductase [Methylobacterium nodulans]|uniref:DSBA oxidoreductase n=1 Tax=Methylobacterium nodulans (strain LMG 21967 / CNCM I-2342 / ORS 2060) TaxID=460265 RepID=B8IXI5_METNO|nr:DsbA family protein [Methylobacterium nodulans]ACL62817.1 DSBA oxidoreductase [Methylobacterium nodulans ORS 2060]